MFSFALFDPFDEYVVFWTYLVEYTAEKLYQVNRGDLAHHADPFPLPRLDIRRLPDPLFD